MFLVTSKNVIKYIIYSIVIIAILSILTRNKLTRPEFVMVAIPIIALYIILDSAKSISKNISTVEKFSMLDNSSITPYTQISKSASPKSTSPKSASPKSASPKSASPKSASPKSTSSNKDLKNTASSKEVSIIGDELRKLYNAIFKKLSDAQAYEKMLEFTKNRKLIKKIYTEKIIKNIEKFNNVDKGFPKLNPEQEKTLIKSLAKTITIVKADLKSSTKPIPKTVPTKTTPKTMRNIIKSAIKEVVKGGISGTEVEGESDWKYNTFNPKRMRPLGEGLQEWQNDYVILNTDKWAPSLVDPPVCKKEKSCPVCPNMSYGYAKQYTTLADFNSSRKIKGPDDINISYLEKLNRGE